MIVTRTSAKQANTVGLERRLSARDAAQCRYLTQAFLGQLPGQTAALSSAEDEGGQAFMPTIRGGSSLNAAFSL